MYYVPKITRVFLFTVDKASFEKLKNRYQRESISKRLDDDANIGALSVAGRSGGHEHNFIQYIQYTGIYRDTLYILYILYQVVHCTIPTVIFSICLQIIMPVMSYGIRLILVNIANATLDIVRWLMGKTMIEIHHIILLAVYMLASLVQRKRRVSYFLDSSHTISEVVLSWLNNTWKVGRTSERVCSTRR